MKIVIFIKPSIIKVCSLFILISLITSIPTQVNASFFDFIIGENAQATDNLEVVSDNSHNSQNMPLLETSINPDLKNINESESVLIVQDDSFVYSDGLLTLPDVNFEKSSISDQINVYTVKQGDTLSEIAETFNVSTNTIRWENNISGKNILIGQKLNILPVTGVKHIVKSGDTIGKIADKYEADTNDILIFNGILKGDVLKKGDIIFVPNGIIKVDAPKTKTSSGISYTTSSNIKVQSGYYIRPVPGGITSSYGPRKGGFHYGVDLRGAKGTSVVASASGIVVNVVSGCVEGKKSCGGRYGNHITITHSNGTETTYAHLSKTSVNIGQTVSQGQKIGEVGNTGGSYGSHLHFEIENANGSKMRPPF